jgi:hypothetical protein
MKQNSSPPTRGKPLIQQHSSSSDSEELADKSDKEKSSELLLDDKCSKYSDLSHSSYNSELRSKNASKETVTPEKEALTP